VPLDFGAILNNAGLDPTQVMAIRHTYVRAHPDGSRGIHADSAAEEILRYTADQSADTRKFPAFPPHYWAVFLAEGGDRARLWSILANRGETFTDGERRTFQLERTEVLAELRDRLVISWRSPRTWWIRGVTASTLNVLEIADARPVPFPGFNSLVLDYTSLGAVISEHRYAAWRTALASVVGIYLITDTRDGRHYVGKADGAENILQRWSGYAANGHGGNVELRGLIPETFRFSVLRVYDPATQSAVINAAEVHFKRALDTVRFGLNGN
jgi:hypothetical protein